MKFFAEFEKERCTVCGECFHQCPVMRLPPGEAVAEMRLLLEGRDTRQVLQKCESCFACDFICPEDAHPAGLILDRWREAGEREGLPRRAAHFIPHQVPNFRTYVIDHLPAEEKALLESWRDESPAEEIFYPGCNFLTAPYLAQTRLLEGFAIRGSLSVCCGEMYFRMGRLDQLKQVARRNAAWLKRMGVKRMVIPCTAGVNLFTNILPRFGFDHPVEVRHFLPLLLERIDRNEIELKQPLDLTVTIQESCHAKALGPEFMELPRLLLSRLGARVIEEERCREKMVCCGIGGGFSHPSSYHPLRLTMSTWRSLGEAKKTGARAIATYCAGCAQMLATGQLTNPANQMPIYHLLELVQMAIGETILPRKEKLKRAAWFLAGVVRHQGPALLSRSRLRLGDLPEFGSDKRY